MTSHTHHNYSADTSMQTFWSFVSTTQLSTDPRSGNAAPPLWTDALTGVREYFANLLSLEADEDQAQDWLEIVRRAQAKWMDENPY